ncbi:AbrB/MazE/SpoVT family DNA-binding domain-containing protein [Sphingomonas bacterium]|uniref:AbrB/MazE/SpoVT family DNA-binding domain-containing protein n=1 Tax=Sphingomonas bacterium TaxID=1895847 RepID=UPI00157630EB|nr:AbrB/MazE/SpoVT family DNA-binding domain-containing protein [Sphingomonas bacterium]
MTYQVRVGEDGRIVLPADLTREIGLKPGDALAIERQQGKLVMQTYDDIVRQGQDRFRALLPEGFSGSLVDQLIADRRAEAARD